MNALNDWHTRNGRRDAAETQWHQQRQKDETTGPESESESESEWTITYHRRVLQFALERVRARTRPKAWACFSEHLLRGRPGAEVAAELGCTTNALFVNASRILQTVREQCADYLEDLGDDPGHLPGRP